MDKETAERRDTAPGMAQELVSVLTLMMDSFNKEMDTIFDYRPTENGISLQTAVCVIGKDRFHAHTSAMDTILNIINSTISETP